MKIVLYVNLILLSCVGFACNHEGTSSEQPLDTSIDTMTYSHTFSEERDHLRKRLSERITGLQAEIDSTRAARQAERDQKRWENYDTRIAEREARRKEFQQWLDNLENQTEGGWQKFKKDADDFFKLDHIDSLKIIK